MLRLLVEGTLTPLQTHREQHDSSRTTAASDLNIITRFQCIQQIACENCAALKIVYLVQPETWTSRNVIYIRLWLWLNLYLVTISTFHHLNKGRSDVRLHVSKPAFNWREFFFFLKGTTQAWIIHPHINPLIQLCVYACVISFSWMLHVALTFSPPALWRDAAPLTRCKKWLTVISLFRLIQYSIP